jgi:N-acetylglucosamine kinase-like BadF-type ATPase
MTRADLLLAIDGGGTKTQALVTDLEGKVLARGLGPSSNLQSVSMEQFERALTTAIDGALMQAIGIGPAAHARNGRIAAACFGLAGVDTPEDVAEVASWVKQRAIAPRFVVVNDAELILAAGTPEGWGVALISGTGSICLGRTATGQTARVGGWGPLIGDEGSGYQVARRALHLATQTADGRADAPALLKAALRHWSLPDAEALMRRVHAPETTPADIAGLAAAVVDLSARGEASARRVVEEAAGDLAAQFRAVVRKLDLARPPLALAGGMLRAHLRSMLTGVLDGEAAGATYVAEPVLGAVKLARRLLRE